MAGIERSGRVLGGIGEFSFKTQIYPVPLFDSVLIILFCAGDRIGSIFSFFGFQGYGIGSEGKDLPMGRALF